eukprot:2850280-Lingulodinium_polyedra.AAC.1
MPPTTWPGWARGRLACPCHRPASRGSRGGTAGGVATAKHPRRRTGGPARPACPPGSAGAKTSGAT